MILHSGWGGGHWHGGYGKMEKLFFIFWISSPQQPVRDRGHLPLRGQSGSRCVGGHSDHALRRGDRPSVHGRHRGAAAGLRHSPGCVWGGVEAEWAEGTDRAPTSLWRSLRPTVGDRGVRVDDPDTATAYVARGYCPSVSGGFGGGGSDCTWNATACCSSRPKGAYGTTDEAFVLILHVCLSPTPDRNSYESIRGGGLGGWPIPRDWGAREGRGWTPRTRRGLGSKNRKTTPATTSTTPSAPTTGPRYRGIDRNTGRGGTNG